MDLLMKKISEKIKKDTSDIGAMEDLLHICLDAIENGQGDKAVPYLTWESDLLEQLIPSQEDVYIMQDLYGLHKKVILAASPYDFHSYLLYIESNRDPSKKFYPPRRKALRDVVRALQELADGSLDLLSISVPPGCGKTTLAIFFLTWLAGRNPNEPMLSGSHSNSFIRGVYDEVLRILDRNGEYLWHDVFPDVEVSGTNAKDCRIDLGRRKRFETLQFTSVGTGNAGLYRAAQLLYCDDLISGIEVALSPDRLDKLWEVYNTDLRQRKIGNHCKELHIATRWSTNDVIGQLENIYGNSEHAKFIVIPALNDEDESNFDYDYGVGFSTEFYHEQREIMDDVNWKALYMNQPIDREGLLFAEDELNTYNGVLPDGEPTKIAVCDVAWGGGDSLSMPFAYQYEDAVYIPDVVFNRGDKTVTYPIVVGRLAQHVPYTAEFEANNGGSEYADHVDDELKKMGIHINITSKKASNQQSKLAKIVQYAPDIKKFYFLDEKHRSKEYRAFMAEVTSFTQNGKVKHDDAPDSLAQLAKKLYHSEATVDAFRRPW